MSNVSTVTCPSALIQVKGMGSMFNSVLYLYFFTIDFKLILHINSLEQMVHKSLLVMPVWDLELVSLSSLSTPLQWVETWPAKYYEVIFLWKSAKRVVPLHWRTLEQERESFKFSSFSFPISNVLITSSILIACQHRYWLHESENNQND